MCMTMTCMYMLVICSVPLNINISTSECVITRSITYMYIHDTDLALARTTELSRRHRRGGVCTCMC